MPAAPANAAAASAGERWRRLIEAQAAPLQVTPLQSTAAEGAPMLLLAEAFVRLPREQRQGLDWIAVAGLGGARSRLRVVGPGALRARGSPISDGLLFQGIELTSILPGEAEAWFALCAVPRRPALSRVLAAIEDLGAACDPGTDAAGNEALYLAIADRLELLAASPGVQWRFAGRIVLPAPQAAVHHLLLARQAPGVPLLVKDGRLLAGSRAESALPWREHEYALLRFGPRPEHQGAVYDIDLLRRQHALIHSGAGAAVPAGEGESYQVKSERLRLSNRLRARYGSVAVQRVAVVTPIAIEASANLAALLQGSDGQLHPGFARRIDAMRSGLRDRMGVAVPGIRLRVNEGDLPPSTYIFMLDEIPLVMNTADPESALVMLPAAALYVDGIVAEDTTHPAGGAQACRVRREHWAAARDKGFDLQEGDAVIVAHLQYLLMRNLDAYVRLSDVVALLTPLYNLHARLFDMRGDVPRLCGMLQSLLSERVPIRALEQIVSRCLECWAMPIHEIVEELRCLPAVRETLPGNEPATPLLLLADEVVAELAGGVMSVGDALVLTLEPAITQQLLAAVRAVVANLSTDSAAILIDEPRLRMPLRKLVELEFPNLMVLSRREAVAAEQRPVAATISLD